MAETAPETTGNNQPVTQNDEHSQVDGHEALLKVLQIHTMTEEMHRELMKWKPMLEQLFASPSMRWKARRHAPQAPAAPPPPPAAG